MTAWRMGFLGIALLGAGVVAPLVVDAQGGGRQGYQAMAVAMACVIVLGTWGGLYAARQSTRAASDAATMGAGSLREALIATRDNRPFRVLLGLFMFIEVAVSVTLAGLPYVADEISDDKGRNAPLFVCVIGPMLVTMPVWRSAAVRMGKKSCLVAASLVYATGASGVLVLPAISETVRFEGRVCGVSGGGYRPFRSPASSAAMLADISVLAIIAALTLLTGYTLTDDRAEELALAQQH